MAAREWKFIPRRDKCVSILESFAENGDTSVGQIGNMRRNGSYSFQSLLNVFRVLQSVFRVV